MMQNNLCIIIVISMKKYNNVELNGQCNPYNVQVIVSIAKQPSCQVQTHFPLR